MPSNPNIELRPKKTEKTSYEGGGDLRGSDVSLKTERWALWLRKKAPPGGPNSGAVPPFWTDSSPTADFSQPISSLSLKPGP